MLPGRGADALYNLGTHVGIEPSEHAGRRKLRRTSQNKSDYTFILPKKSMT